MCGAHIRQVESTEFVLCPNAGATDRRCPCPVGCTEANDVSANSKCASGSINRNSGITQNGAGECARRSLENPIVRDRPVVVIGLDADSLYRRCRVKEVEYIF